MDSMTSGEDVAHDVEFIKQSLGVHLSDIAFMLDVQRAAVYRWASGARPHRNKLARLVELHGHVTTFLKSGVTVNKRALRRPIINGLNFMECFRAGMPTETYVPELIDMLGKDEEERDRMLSRFSRRVRAAMDETDDPNSTES
jgi:predicted transcriptional regulator